MTVVFYERGAPNDAARARLLISIKASSGHARAATIHPAPSTQYAARPPLYIDKYQLYPHTLFFYLLYVVFTQFFLLKNMDRIVRLPNRMNFRRKMYSMCRYRSFSINLFVSFRIEQLFFYSIIRKKYIFLIGFQVKEAVRFFYVTCILLIMMLMPINVLFNGTGFTSPVLDLNATNIISVESCWCKSYGVMLRNCFLLICIKYKAAVFALLGE